MPFLYVMPMRATDNIKLGYTSYGDESRPTLVITPGWATDSSFLAPFKDIFKDYHLLLVDMPGYGRSRHLAEFSKELRHCGHLILNTVPKGSTLIAWSLSSLAAIEACALDREHNIARLVTICGTPRFPCDPYWPGIDYKYVLKSLRLLESGNKLRNIKLFFMMQTQSKLLTKEQADFLINCFDGMEPISFDVLKNGISHMSKSDLRAACHRLSIPCLHIFGGKDRLVKQELSKKLIEPPYHRCCVLSESAHVPFLSEPEALRESILMFLKNTQVTQSSAEDK